MKIGVSRPYGNPDEFLHVLQAARRYGFAGVQLKSVPHPEFINAPHRFKEQYGELADLAAGGLIAYPGGNIANWVDHASGVLPFAAAIGAPHVCLCSNVSHSDAPEEDVNAMAAALELIGSRARQLGLRVSIHNHVGSLVETEADIARLLERVDPALCGLTLDTAHAAKAGISHVHQLVPRFAAHLLNVHLKDLDAAGNFCALGQGVLPLEPILTALREIDYAQWLIVDEETRSLDTDRALCIARQWLDAHLPAA